MNWIAKLFRGKPQEEAPLLTPYPAPYGKYGEHIVWCSPKLVWPTIDPGLLGPADRLGFEPFSYTERS